MNLSYENWENVFDSECDNDVNVIFNNFLNTHLMIFYSRFPLHKSAVSSVELVTCSWTGIKRMWFWSTKCDEDNDRIQFLKAFNVVSLLTIQMIDNCTRDNYNSMFLYIVAYPTNFERFPFYYYM